MKLSQIAGTRNRLVVVAPNGFRPALIYHALTDLDRVDWMRTWQAMYGTQTFVDVIKSDPRLLDGFVSILARRKRQ